MRYAIATILVFLIVAVSYLFIEFRSGVATDQRNDDLPESVAQIVESATVKSGEVPSMGGLFSVIGEVDAGEVQRITPWLQEVYIPEYPYILRHRIVEIDSAMLGAKLEQSWLAQTGQLGQMGSDQVNNTDIVLNLFPDAELRVAVNEYSVGRFGHIHARAVVTANGSGRERIYLEISPDSTLSAVVKIQDGHYMLTPSSEPPYHVLAELDREAAARRRTVD